MKASERIANVLLGASALSWGVLGLVFAEAASRFTAVRITVAALNVTVGLLFLVRRPLLRHGTLVLLLISLPSFAAGGLAFRLARPPENWPAAAQLLFAAGGLAALTSLAFLGRSFAVLPAVREVVTRGPYRLIRHPAYAGELAMILAFALAAPHWLDAWPAAAAVPLMLVRILAEERTLSTEPVYRSYCRAVPRRLIPGVW